MVEVVTAVELPGISPESPVRLCMNAKVSSAAERSMAILVPWSSTMGGPRPE